MLKQHTGESGRSEDGLSSISHRIHERPVALAPAQDETLEFSIYVDMDAPRPPYWEELKQQLVTMGFQLEGGWGKDDNEVFMPRTFFSADIGIEATRSYGPNQERQMARHLQTITDCLETQDSATPARKKRHQHRRWGQR